jgi:hypothetical protein
MKATLSRVQISALALALSTSAFLIAADVKSQPSDLTVHEWGTFTSVAGLDGSAIDSESLSLC